MDYGKDGHLFGGAYLFIFRLPASFFFAATTVGLSSLIVFDFDGCLSLCSAEPSF